MTTPSVASARLSYDQWTKRLADHFFRNEYADMHVMFFVDDECLARLGDSDPAQAVREFVEAIAPKLWRGRPRQLFSNVRRLTAKWKLAGGEGPPPCLPVLALSVLAATHMHSTRQRASHNYYDWLLDLLRDAGVRASMEEMNESYGDSVPAMWNALAWWLDDRHRGRLGWSTIAKHQHRTYMGYADSQTLFESSDRDKLSQFFHWLRLKPSESIDPRELVQYFRLWTARREDLNLGTQVMLEEADYPAQLAALLHAAASSWEGVVREEGGRVTGTLAVALTGPPQPRLFIASPRPAGFPAALDASMPLGRVVHLRADDISAGEGITEWYEGLELEVTTSLLERGLQIAAKGYVLRLPPHHVHVLHKSKELGCWASVEQLRPSEPAWLLVRARSLEEVKGYLSSSARDGWAVVQRQGIAPNGWVLIRDVVVDAGATAPESLRRLAPREQNRLLLSGGLPLPRGTGVYVTGGEPDLALPPMVEVSGDASITVDGLKVPIPDDSTVVRLADLTLDAGAHHVSVTGISRSFLTLRTNGYLEPPTETRIGHRIRQTSAGLKPQSLDACCQPKESVSGREILISGASLDCGPSIPPPGRPPLVLPVGAQHITLLGARPGEIEVVCAPARPPWMADCGLEYRVFEYEPEFDVVWSIADFKWRGPHIRLVHTADPGSADRNRGSDALQGWAEAFRRYERPEDPNECALWLEYGRAGEAHAGH
jgi:hypothetical protein